MGSEKYQDSFNPENSFKDENQMEELLRQEEETFANQKIPETPEEVGEFFIRNYRLIHAVLKPYRGLDEYEDLLQEASIGFLKGIQSYDPDKKVKLTTYAYVCAKNQVKMYLRRSCAKSRSGTVVSLDASLDGDSDDEKNSLLNRDLESANPLAEVVSMEDRVYSRILFEKAMYIVNTQLTPIQRIVIYRHLEGIPQSRTAKELNTSQSEISKILKNAICELRLLLIECGVISDDE